MRHLEAGNGLKKAACPFFLVFFLVSIVLLAMAMGTYGCSSQSEQAIVSPSMSQYLADIAPIATDPQNGRDFRHLSIHQNGSDLLFIECSHELNPAGGCYVLLYNLSTQSLSRYGLPERYFYSSASFSPRGHHVVMSRVPKTDGSEEKSREAYESSEIVLMKTDGTDFKVLQLAKGNKVAPIMSEDETRVAYWRSTLRPPGSKSFSSKFDIWEVNLKTGQDNLYAGPFQFFTVSGLQYFSQDEMLIGAYGPMKYAQSYYEYRKKYNDSEVYRVQRGALALPEPILTEVNYAANPSVDKERNIYFSGDRPGSSFFRKSTSGVIEQWKFPPFPKGIGMGNLRAMVPAPDGSYMVFVYEYVNTPWNYKPAHQYIMGLLNTGTSEWSRLRIPPLQSSTPIAVKAAD